VSEARPPLSLYVHLPFCQARCTYCDFNTYSGMGSLFGPYVEAVCREIASWSREPGPVHTIYLGGGTPTVLPVPLIGRVLAACCRVFLVDEESEISCEANPGTVTLHALRSLRALGVNRLSLGVQSFDDAELRLLGRIHSIGDVLEGMADARRAGFENVNLDLIYGLPGQALSTWQQSLSRALALEPEHLSLYGLTLEEGTPLQAAVKQGRLPAPDPDLAADMYELALEQLRRADYIHYEISNWARGDSLFCRHNLTYWRNRPYLGFGAGSHSFYGGRRWWNAARPEEYIARVQGKTSEISETSEVSELTAVEGQEEVSTRLEMAETMILGLRLIQEGVSVEEFSRRFGQTPHETYPQEMESLGELGLLAWDEARVRLTPRAWLLANVVFQRFL
jgi:oxygen-independent coproporphyrinogen-3 oxidase